jgi:hypothetical protein
LSCEGSQLILKEDRAHNANIIGACGHIIHE